MANEDTRLTVDMNPYDDRGNEEVAWLTSNCKIDDQKAGTFHAIPMGDTIEELEADCQAIRGVGLVDFLSAGTRQFSYRPDYSKAESIEEAQAMADDYRPGVKKPSKAKVNTKKAAQLDSLKGDLGVEGETWEETLAKIKAAQEAGVI